MLLTKHLVILIEQFSLDVYAPRIGLFVVPPRQLFALAEDSEGSETCGVAGMFTPDT